MSDIPNLAQPFQLRPPSRAPLCLLVLVLTARRWLPTGSSRKRRRQTPQPKRRGRISRRLGQGRGDRSREDPARNEKSELEIAKNELAKSIQAKEGEIAELQGTYDQIQDKMKARSQGGDQSEQTGGKLRVVWWTRSCLIPVRRRSPSAGKACWARAMAEACGVPDKQIQFPATPTRRPSQQACRPIPHQLGTVCRAGNQRGAFPGREGQSATERMVPAAMGNTKPVATNKTPAGRAHNRRIEILLTPMFGAENPIQSKLKERPQPRKNRGGQ